jgi:hypothetical protein
MPLVLSTEQRAELRDLMALGFTRNEARYRILTPEQREAFRVQVKVSAHRRSITSPRAWMLGRVASAALRRGIPFEITEADLDWPTHCPVLGVELVYPVARSGRSGRRPGPASNVASIDRIDNARGYVPGNVAIVSYWVNVRKGDATPEQLRTIADYYSGATTV